MPNPATHLKCRNCSARYDLAAIHVCVECFAPLEIGYDEDRLRRVTRESIEAGPQSLWRYVGLLPAGHDEAPGSASAPAGPRCAGPIGWLPRSA